MPYLKYIDDIGWHSRGQRFDLAFATIEGTVENMRFATAMMRVVVGGYDKYNREDVVRFVDRIVNSSLSLFQ